MDLKKISKKKKWHLMGSWNHPAILADLVCGSVSDKKFPRILNYAPTGYLMVGTHQCVIAEEYQKHIEQTTRLPERNLLSAIRKLKSLIHTANKRTYRNNYKKLDYPKLKKFLSDIAWHGPNWYQLMLIDNVLQVLYPKSLPPSFSLNGISETPESVLAKAALPKKMFPMIKERNELLRIAIDIKKGKKVEKKLIDHTRKYKWMNSMNWWLEPFTVSYYRRKAKSLAKKNPEKLLKELVKARRRQYRQATLILRELKKKYPRAWRYLDIIRDLADLKEENWDAVSITGTRLRNALTELALKYGLTYKEFMMTNKKEMLETLRQGRLQVPLSELKSRVKGFGVIYADGKGYMVSGPKVKEYIKVILAKPKQVQEVKGMVVWRGKETGRVCVLATSHELAKMKTNGILVCPMTDPDYMPAIQKAKAIVTDQGGLLCHAAIVARELNKPCIIGTKIATRVLKDGDLVEVDADKGVVKVLGKK